MVWTTIGSDCSIRLYFKESHEGYEKFDDVKDLKFYWRKENEEIRSVINHVYRAVRSDLL